ncbi:DEAD/DEAH box helicase [Mycoplasma sp. Mirounga ES2805-ORL]|uniref:AAA domain-containing protein n=1 Tax=Mycoplasma sp. Mirounga ES2805-ORL TaxID=754514 RepID=UPI00197BABD5|nr:DEAD/DEAH box helicase [Mycoplasma sp. Mirounga ES2805-ORL]QSF13788.1 DNA2/NAM7 family helicase [Mycoplasma sp. Mirounga ES2805-ORL]
MKNQIDKKYQSILSNLLDISPNDKAVFTRVNNNNSFDFYNLFGPEVFSFIYEKKDFDIPILEVNLLKVIKDLEQINDANEFKQYIMDNNFEIADYKIRQLDKNFASVKEKFIEEIKLNFQKQNLKWKLFINKAKTINEETNIWPMHLGFYFVRLVNDGKSIYAPLFLKEVYIELRNGRPFLVSNGDIKINEKVQFILNNSGFDINIDDDYGSWSIKKLVSYLYDNWKDIFDLNFNINQPFENVEPEGIKNSSIQFKGGVVLGLFQPSGGYVRNRMLEIINNNEINKILDIEFNKNIYKNKVKNTIFNPKTSIFKITPTNLSQDKAIASSLNQNTIIWGPPGTGKSQTIVNILTNLLVFGKTSLVCSQKKAALEVIKNRMQDLSIFCLFMLNSRNMNKKNFYLPLRDYLDFLENYDSKADLRPQRILRKKEIEFVNNIESLSSDLRFEKAVKLISNFKENFNELNSNFWAKARLLNSNLVYPKQLNFSSEKDITKQMLKLNKVYGKIWNPKNYKVKKVSSIIFNSFKNFYGDLNIVLPLIDDLKEADFGYVESLLKIIPNENGSLTSNILELKKFIAERIIEKVNKFTEQEKEDYQEFAATIRLATLEPYKFIKKFPNIIKKLFPIIIVTPEADLSEWKKKEFDYAILDESSQIFLEKGLPVLYLAKIKILAGDDQQMKPSNWFGSRLSDDESIYGKVDSLLDFAKGIGVYNVLLDKNYRSNYAALMTFSSKNFYNSNLDIIDSASDITDYSPIDVYEVNGKWEDNKNELEAQLAIKLAKDNLVKYNKIILLCFNAKQQDYITNEIFKKHPKLENAVNNNLLLLRNIENIQGDEADLVIVSVAYDKSVSIYSTYVGRPGGKNALNVAISRAKDKMIVVKSLKAEDLTINTSNDDSLIFKKWLKFLELDKNDKQNFLNLENQFISKINPHNSNEDIKNDSNFKNEIKNYLTSLLKDKPFLELVENENLGTVLVDFSIKRSGTNIFSIIVDDYNYSNNVEEYVRQKDLIKFIKSKKYEIYWLDRINWEFNKSEIELLIHSLREVSNEKTIIQTLDIPTHQLENIMGDESKLNEIKKQIKEQEKSLKDKNIEYQTSDQSSFINVNSNIDQNDNLEDDFNSTITTYVIDKNQSNDYIENVYPEIDSDNSTENILSNNENYLERPVLKIASFEETKKQWEDTLTTEAVILDTNQLQNKEQ